MKYLDLAIVNETIKTVDIKGKEYAEVNQRIKAFRMIYPEGIIFTNMISNENGICVFKAQVGFYDKDGSVKWLGEGHAYEKENSTFINKTSYIENCETSAVGRALGMAGFGIDVSVASAEEVQNAMINQELTQEEADAYTLTFGKYKDKTIKEVYEEDKNYIRWLLGNTKDEKITKIIEMTTGLKVPTEADMEEWYELNEELMNLIEITETDLEKIEAKYNVSSTSELLNNEMKEIIDILKKKVGGK